MQVLTTKGLVEFSELRFTPVVEVGDNYVKVLMKYFLGDELVKQSVHIDMLKPLGMVAEQGKLG